ncbi:protein of unknown function [Methylocaldum szegediense]|uniref:Uncharacterized protein n=1 Tax=Methylocaldum szegediense TaxID=73780 RepID=A0ABN8X7L9_9GAMM|nr:protein of unknown function [Methylocaldum szegediense]
MCSGHFWYPGDFFILTSWFDGNNHGDGLVPGQQSTGTVRAGDDFEQVTVGIFEVQSASAVIVIDLAAPVLSGIGPVIELPLADAAKNAIEIVLADQEGVVMRVDGTVGLVEIERDTIAELDH